MMRRVWCGVALSVLVSTASVAQQKDQSFQQWTVYTTDLEGKKTAYVGSYPTKESGSFKSRDKPYFLVTCVGNGVEVSLSPGYPLKEESEVAVQIGDHAFRLFTKGELAWARDAKGDAAIVSALKAGSSMTVKAVSAKGSESTDQYSLKGFSAAYQRMHALCAPKKAEAKPTSHKKSSSKKAEPAKKAVKGKAQTKTQ